MIVGLHLAMIPTIAWSFWASEFAKEVHGWPLAGGDRMLPCHRQTAFPIAGVVAMWSMLYNGVIQFPNSIGNVQSGFSERLWVFIVTGLLLGLVVAGGQGWSSSKDP